MVMQCNAITTIMIPLLPIGGAGSLASPAKPGEARLSPASPANRGWASSLAMSYRRGRETTIVTICGLLFSCPLREGTGK